MGFIRDPYKNKSTNLSNQNWVVTLLKSNNLMCSFNTIGENQTEAILNVIRRLRSDTTYWDKAQVKKAST